MLELKSREFPRVRAVHADIIHCSGSVLRYSQYVLIIYWYLFNIQYCHTKSKPEGLDSSLIHAQGPYWRH